MSFFDEYFKYAGETEAPTIYIRWSAIAMISAWLGRDVWIRFGHDNIYPNQYILLMGTPGARKGTGLGLTKKLLRKAGYKTFANDRTSEERFLSDMQPKLELADDMDLESLVLEAPGESFVCIGEFLDWIGHGNMGFLTLLTNLWDNLPTYEHPKLHGASVSVYKPTVNILGAATVKGFGLACPPEALGTGVLSRLLFIYSDPTDIKITWPEDVPDDADAWLVKRLRDIKDTMKGVITKTPEASKIMAKMYHTYPGIEDARFGDYSARRFTHLLKLAMIIAVADLRTCITERDALEANTILSAAEKHMPKALGEFGKSRYSDVSNTIMNILNVAVKPVTHNKLWQAVAKDLSKQTELHDVMRNLLAAEKIQVLTVAGVQGYMAKHIEHKTWTDDLLLQDYLLPTEY